MTRPHLLPCQIHYQGNAKVKEYFQPKNDTVDGIQECSFRGHLLKGEALKLNDGLEGWILEKDDRSINGKTEKLNKVDQFEEFIVWHHDVVSKYKVPYMRVNEWASIAKVLHSVD